MSKFPSIAWCEALVRILQADPGVAGAVQEWAGRSIGVVVARDAGLDRDFCIFAKPHASEPRLTELKACEDEDDLELEEPDYLFKVPFGTARQMLGGRVDAVDVLRRGQVKVEGDLAFLITYAQKHQRIGQSAVGRVETSF